MHKFTIFTLLLSATVVAIVSELIFNDYLKKDTFNQESSQNSEQVIVDVQNSDQIQTIGENNINIAFLINESLLTQAGFTVPVLKKIDFSGKIFQLIELAGVQETEISKFQIYEGDNFAATLYEIMLKDENATNEIYDYIKTNATGPNLTVNESNTFEKSFYINDSENKTTVFLVVQINANIYGFEYPHATHTKIKEIIALLSK